VCYHSKMKQLFRWSDDNGWVWYDNGWFSKIRSHVSYVAMYLQTYDIIHNFIDCTCMYMYYRTHHKSHLVSLQMVCYIITVLYLHYHSKAMLHSLTICSWVNSPLDRVMINTQLDTWQCSNAQILRNWNARLIIRSYTIKYLRHNYCMYTFLHKFIA